MSDLEVQSIIKKYDRAIQKPRINHLNTERKRQSRDPHLITFMDHNYTPAKQVKQSRSTPTEQTSQVEALLRQLDDSERRYVVLDKTYADVCRKYEKLKQAYDGVSTELEKERKARIQDLIDTDNKLHLIQIEKQKYERNLHTKNDSVLVLQQQLSRKDEQIIIFQHQLKLISQKLCEALDSNKGNIATRNFTQGHNAQIDKYPQNKKEKYEKSQKLMIAEIEKLTKDLIEKQREKKGLLSEMEEMSRRHLNEEKQIKEALVKNQEQYKGWLDENKKERLNLIDKYEQQIRQLRKVQLFEKLQQSDNSIEDTARGKVVIREIQQKNIDSQNQLKSIKLELEALDLKDKQSQIKVKSLREELKHIKAQYNHQINENKRLLASLKQEEQRNEKMRSHANRNEAQVESLRLKNQNIQSSNRILEKQVQKLKTDMEKELKSLMHVKKELDQAANNELNMNSSLTQVTVQLQVRIKTLQAQLSSTTTQLYGERLEKAKIIDQLEETKVQLKRQYDLSLENTKKQLSEQIKQSLQSKTEKEIEVQKMYLKMFKLERQYELLKSEVVTSEQMLKLGTKMGKYYQKKAK